MQEKGNGYVLCSFFSVLDKAKYFLIFVPQMSKGRLCLLSLKTFNLFILLSKKDECHRKINITSLI